MMPASNKGMGMNIGFPDVCLTPVGPAVVPIPYPNLAMNAQAAEFAETVMITMMPGLNMASKIPMTMGDEAGSANPVFKQMGQYTMGNPIVNIEKMPGISLLCPTTGNDMNNPIGAVLVPSITNVFYSFAKGPTAVRELPGAVELSLDDLIALDQAMRSAPPIESALHGETGYLPIDLFTEELPARMHCEVERLILRGARRLLLDLRGSRGGLVESALSLADDFLAEGTCIACVHDADGDVDERVARGTSQRTEPVVVWIDRHTASAAELFAGSMQANGRALLVGERSFGKASGQAVMPHPDRPGALLINRMRFTLPEVDGTSAEVHGVGLKPDWETGVASPAALLDEIEIVRATLAEGSDRHDP